MLADASLSHYAPDTIQPIRDMTSGDALRRAAALAGDRTALVEVVPAGMPPPTGAATTDRRWSYAELLADAEVCARWLLTRFRPGDHICLWAPNVPEWVIVQYGAALAGLVLVTANPSLRAEELRHVVERSDAKILIHATEFRGTDMTAIAAAATDIPRIAIGEVRIALERSWPTGALPRVASGDPAQMQFTSGTTGRPKGALLSHRSLVTNAAFVAGRVGQRDGDVFVTPMPLFHTAGSVLGVLGAAASLSTLVLPLMFDPALMLATIERERATLTGGVPTMLVAMLAELDGARHDVSTLRLLYSGGAPIAPELLTRVEEGFGCRMMSVYGQTELSPIICATGYDDAPADRAGTAGRPLPQVEVRIADPVAGSVIPIGTEGEIQARGYQTMIGYFGLPVETARTVMPDGWLRTGDLGHMDARGYVRVTGRLSDMIIRGGENIYPAEVEAALLRHPAVAEVAVFGVPDAVWGEMVAASVRLRDDAADTSGQALKDHCRALLSPQKTPAAWYVADVLPLTASGKVQKYRLAKQAGRGELALLR